MNMWEAVKGPKRMSLSHWRYRLLHWCFNVDPAVSPEKSPLPEFLYTHYCPLFHLTNLIALLFPAVIAAKLTLVVCIAFCRAAIWMVENADEFYVRVRCRWRLRRRAETEDESADKIAARQARTLARERAAWIAHVRKYAYRCCATWDFHDAWFRARSFEMLSAAEGREIFDELLPKLREAHERNKARRDRLRQRMIFWVNFSHDLFKWVFYVLYAVMAVAAVFGFGYVLLGLSSLMISVVTWLATFDPIPTLIFLATVLGKMLIFGFSLALPIYAIWRFKLFGVCGNVVADAARAVAMPLSLVGAVASAPFRWIYGAAKSAAEFAAIFYEENCPPIIIVSDDEADLDIEA